MDAIFRTALRLILFNFFGTLIQIHKLNEQRGFQ